jgi:hypothetical protein
MKVNKKPVNWKLEVGYLSGRYLWRPIEERIKMEDQIY